MYKLRSKTLKLICLLACVLTCTLASAQNTAEEQSLQEQLLRLSNFEQLQNPQLREPDTAAINTIAFFESLHDAEEFSEKTAQRWSAFFELTFSREGDEHFSRRLQILQKEGEKQFAALPPEIPQHELRPFTDHVKEAIELNHARKEYYASISNGATNKVSLLYTSLEYCLLPLSGIFDRWAQNFRNVGIPVLSNDFVSMSNTPLADQQLLRRGMLDRNGRKELRKKLRSWQWKCSAAATRKDFIEVQLLVMNVLYDLRQIELRYQCNLALTIHFVESVGLAARNADNLSHLFARRTDNFYRAFIALQISGVKLFSQVDLQAQPFHRAGIGIIVNDLPAIPFP